MTAFVCLAVAALAGARASGQAALAQQPLRDPAAAGAPARLPAGTGVVAGTIVSPESGHPVRRARVTLVGTDPSVNKSTTADDQGAFMFEALPAAAYTLTAAKPGLLDSIYGQKVPGSGRPGTTIQLADGQRLDRIRLSMPRGGVLTGTVLDEFGDPSFGTSVRSARYVIRSGSRTLLASGTATTDDRGVYRITSLLPGEYIVTATANAAAAKMDEAKAMAEKAAVLRQVEFVRAAAGDAAAAAQAVAAQRAVAAAAGDLAAPPEPTDAYATVYYPGSSNGPAALAVVVGVGEEKPNIDLQLTRVPVARLSGSVIAPEGSSFMSDIQLLDRGQLSPIQGVRSATIRADGTFAFTGVPPGRHTLTVFASLPTSPSGVAAPMPPGAPLMEMQVAVRMKEMSPREILWGTVDVTMAGRPTDGVVVTMQRGMAISGSVAFEGGAPPADLTRVSLKATPLDANDATLAFELPGAPPAQLDAGGRFTIRGVVPGQYRIAASGAPGFSLKSAAFGGRDALDFSVDVKPGEDVAAGVVTFTTRSADVNGALVDASGAAAAQHTVIIFAADNRFWTPQSRRIQGVRPATNGRFSFRGLPPGDYRLAAVTDVEPGQWFDPEFLRQVAGASTPLTLLEGEKKEQSLRVR